MGTHYAWDEVNPAGHRLRNSLEQYRSAKSGLERELGAMSQMTDEEVQVTYGFLDGTINGAAKLSVEMAAAAKAEFAADVARLSNDAEQSNFRAAMQQMLDQFS